MHDDNRVDGVKIDIHQARLSGTVDVDLSDSRLLSLANGGDVMLVVVARPKGVNVDETKSGDIKRVDKLVASEMAVVRVQSMRDQLSETLGLEPSPLQQLTAATPVPALGPGTDGAQSVAG